MPDSPIRISSADDPIIATQSLGRPARWPPGHFRPQASGNGLSVLHGLAKPAPTVAALLATNAALVTRNRALRAALDRQTAGKGAALPRREGRVAAAMPLGEVLRLVTARTANKSEPGRVTPGASMLALLTLRQAQILHLVLAGHPSKNIAADLHISQRTVENHRAAIMRRTGATSLPALARMAVGAAGRADCKAAARPRTDARR